MKLLKSICLASSLIALSFSAQVKLSENPIKMKLQTKNMHIARGVQITDNTMVNGNLELSTKDDFFTFGISGSSTFVKDFKEFNYYVKLAKSGFTLSLWDISSNTAENSFDYTKNTGRIMDLSLEYKFAESFPLKLLWSTIVFGGSDRGEINHKGKIGNKYTSYIEADYPVITGKKVNLNVGAGGTFAFRNPSGIKSNLNGNTAGIINIYATASRVLEINDYKLPIELSGIWNPEAQKTYLQITVDIVSF